VNETIEQGAIDALKKAVTKAGSQTALANALNISPQAVQQWLSGNRVVPVKRAKAIEKLTGIKRKQLRPDIFA